MLSRRGFLSLAGMLGTAALAGCAPASEKAGELSTTLFCFDTVCTLRGVMPQEALDGAAALCDRFEQLFSRTIETSDVARINAAGGEPVEVAEETADLIAKALGYCEASDGRFDITIGAVSQLWDFHNEVVPDHADIEAALAHVDWHAVQTDGMTVRLLDPKAAIDLGGIAKGWIADALIAYFAGEGVESACVNLGGNVAVLGSKPDGSPWRVGIQDPDSAEGEGLIARIEIADGSVVTSGLYERSFERDGRRYWHILDPKTGYPVETSIESASIYASASIDGDGYTKTLFFMEPAEGIAYLESLGLAGLIATSDGELLATENSTFELL